AHDLCGRIEAHRLRIEQRAREHRRMMAFDPRRDVDKMRKTRRMAFGESVAAEAFDLPEAAFGEILFVTTAYHAVDHLLAELVDGSDMAERRHCAAQAIGFLRRELCRHNGKLHGLFLEQRHALGLAENILQFVCGSEFW